MRDREDEFARRGTSRAAVVQEIEAAIAAVEHALTQVDDVKWRAEYPLEVGGRRLSNARFALHLSAHLAYHFGQMDYHRRIVAPESGTAATMSLAEL